MESQESTKKKKRGDLIVVASAKGGVGKTLLAVNLAAALCKKNMMVSLVDGDFQFGDISLSLDLHTTFTLKDVVEDKSLDSQSVLSYLNRHESGIRVLAAPDRPEYADLIVPNVITDVLTYLTDHHQFTIVDTGVGFHENNLNMFELADQILCMTNLEMSTLKNTKLMLETFDMLGLAHKVTLVINRATMESVIKPTDVTDILGIDDPIYIPNDFQTSTQSLNIGVPFVTNQPKTEIAKAYFKMAERLYSKTDTSLAFKKEGFREKFNQKHEQTEEESTKKASSGKSWLNPFGRRGNA